MKNFISETILLLLMLALIASFYFMYQNVRHPAGDISGQEPVANPNLKL